MLQLLRDVASVGVVAIGFAAVFLLSEKLGGWIDGRSRRSPPRRQRCGTDAE